ncbi:MAG: HPP family protein [Gaiellales bacterium]
MREEILDTIALVQASIARDATLLEAAGVLVRERVSAAAVLDPDGRVVGIFNEGRLIHGLFPGYLSELHHTAFAVDDPQILDRCARQAATELVEDHMAEAVLIDDDTSATHVAELFLHHELAALPVVDGQSFVGMLRRADFAQAMLRRHRDEPEEPAATS